MSTTHQEISLFKCTIIMNSNLSEFIRSFKIPSEWIYRGEGNCNVVLSLPLIRKIIRIRKIDRPKTFIEWFIVWISNFLYWYCGKSIKEEFRDLKFYSMITRPLIGRKYTSDSCQVILKKRQVKTLEKELSKYRPEFRQVKILQYERAALFDDFAFLPKEEYEYLPFKLADNTFAIEMKPKQGWRSLSENHFPKCLFCMNQYLKLEKKQIKHISKYCPEDLFSGNPERMRSAIKSLVEVPQNNFKIFKNGIFCFGDNVNTSVFNEIVQDLFETSDELNRLQEEFYKLIQQCLITNLFSTDVMSNCTKKLFCEWNDVISKRRIGTVLPKGCVLKQILSVQMLDTEGSNYYNKLLTAGNFKDWDYVNMLLNGIETSNGTCLKCAIMILSNNTEKERDLKCVPYMISSIARDCSLMITLRKIEENIGDNLEMKNIIKTNYGYYLINIGVFDLYPKPLSIVKKHYKRNKDFFRAYVNATERSDKFKTI